MQLTIFNELIIHFCCCWLYVDLISHKPKKIQNRAIMAFLNSYEIVDKSLRYIFLKNGCFRENNK